MKSSRNTSPRSQVGEHASTASVTMLDVALIASVHPSTVSRALKNDPRISNKVKEHVQAVADRLGYRPNPLIAALSTLRRKNAQLAMPTALAYIQREKLQPTAHLIGVTDMAAAHGYRVETYTINDQLSDKRLNQILTHCNTRGIILAPLPEAHGSFTLDWQRFATVALEYSFTAPCFDRVVPDSFLSVTRVLDECIKMGHTRIGLVLTHTVHERNEGLLAAAYLYGKQQRPELANLMPLIISSPSGSSVLTDWIKREQPQVIISSNHMIPRIKISLAQLGIISPAQMGIVNLNTFPGETSYAGISLNPSAMGSRAVEILVNKLNNNQFGIPSTRVTVQTHIEWIPGGTLLPAAAMTSPLAFRQQKQKKR